MDCNASTMRTVGAISSQPLLRPASSSCSMRHHVAPSDLLKDTDVFAGTRSSQNEYDGCNAFEDNDSAVSSLFSELEDDSVWDEVEEDHAFLRRKKERRDLNHLEAQFKRRDRILDRISQGKSRTFVAMMRRHEQRVRSHDRERLILKLLYRKKAMHLDYSNQGVLRASGLKEKDVGTSKSLGKSTADDEAEDLSLVHVTITRDDLEALIESYERKSKQKRSFFSFLRDLVTFELYSTVPAVFSLTFHSLLEYLFYEIANVIVSIGRKSLHLHEDQLIFLVFLIGITLIRMSGYLYWWLSDSDYNCMKFEFHNRLRLGKYDARLFQWMQEHIYVRCLIFVLGYYFCFIAVIHFYYRFAHLWDQSATMMKDLPSASSKLEVCASELPPWSFQLELDSVKEWQENLRIADVAYTSTAFSTRSFEMYWIENGDVGTLGYPILSQFREVTLMIAVALGSLAALTWYGFLYWHKY